MKTKFNFNSQICTTREQSERLLALSLKKETADMTIHIKNDDGWYVTAEPFYEWEDDMNTIPSLEETEPILPAWSLGRLIEICGKDRLPISFHKKGKVKIRVNHIHPTHDGRSGYNYYDSIIDCIEWLIKEGNFNKKYLV